MTKSPKDEIEYTNALIAGLELRWGAGYMSPGGPEEVARLLQGIDIRGREVLDIGCGTGGVDLVLVQIHGAKLVLGLDIGRAVLDQASDRATAAGLSDRLAYMRVEVGPLPLTDASFDVVFSKDAIMHVADKHSVYTEVMRVLRPGGMFVASDWFRGEAPFSKEMEAYVASARVTLALDTLEGTVRTLQEAGFVDVQTRDRNGWYREFVREELAEATGANRARLIGVLGEEEAVRWLERTRVKTIAVDQGQLRPGHIRGRKPG